MDSLTRQTPRLARLGAAVLTAFLSAALARADMITPNSIPHPPPMVSDPIGSDSIDSSGDLVTTQYTALGLRFPTIPENKGMLTGSTAAITNLSGVDVWAPAVLVKGGPAPAALDYFSGLTMDFVKPGYSGPATANSVSVEVLQASNPKLIAYGQSGSVLGWTQTQSGTGPHGGALYSFQVPDISSIEIIEDLGNLGGTPSWGVAGIAFTPSAATAPEPCGLALAEFGAAALAGWTWRRRRIQAA